MSRSLEGRQKTVGYRMIDSLIVKNFRCFESREIRGSSGSNYKLQVFYGGNESSVLPLNRGIASHDSPVLRLITFKGTDVSGKPFEVLPDISPVGLGPMATGEGAPVLFFSSTVLPSGPETAQRFSNLRKEYKHQPLIDAVVKEFQIVKGLDIEIDSGTSYIFADVGGPRKLRLAMVSGGLDKLVSIL